MKHKGLVFGSLMFFMSPLSAAENETQMRGFISLAKMTGACGIFNSMITFQEGTKMPGGDEFVVRFWSAEAARLGMSLDEYADQCGNSIRSYEKMWKLFTEVDEAQQ